MRFVGMLFSIIPKSDCLQSNSQSLNSVGIDYCPVATFENMRLNSEEYRRIFFDPCFYDNGVFSW